MPADRKRSHPGPGRPRLYDPEKALEAALEVFQRHGFAGASLDAISEATGMNRPSLYAAFGNKKSLYRKALVHHGKRFYLKLKKALFAGPDLEKDLNRFYLAAVSVYQADPKNAPGCPTLCTAVTEAALDREIRKDVAQVLDRIDSLLIRRFEEAREAGELASGDPGTLGRMAAALLYSLSVRIRAGQKGFRSRAFVKAAVAELLG